MKVLQKYFKFTKGAFSYKPHLFTSVYTISFNFHLYRSTHLVSPLLWLLFFVGDRFSTFSSEKRCWANHMCKRLMINKNAVNICIQSKSESKDIFKLEKIELRIRKLSMYLNEWQIRFLIKTLNAYWFLILSWFEYS